MHLHNQFIRPPALWPNLEAFDGTLSLELMRVWSASPLEADGPDDFAALAADESKLDVFIAGYRHSIVPRMRTAADILMSRRHLLDYPSPTYLDGLFAASGIDWAKFLPNTIDANRGYGYTCQILKV